MWQVKSPNGSLIFTITPDEQGQLFYMVEKHGKLILERSAMGISTSLEDFTNGLTWEQLETAVISETYSIPAGKKAVYENKANETALTFIKNGIKIVLRLRAYDDGAAFRYEIPTQGEAFFINYETTDFRFPESFDKLWLQDWVSSYEGPYNATTWGISHDGRRYGMPSLIHSPKQGIWVMINEANVLNKNGAYCISHLQGTPGNALQLCFAPEEGGAPVPSTLPFHSPWRYVLAADNLNEVVNATMNYNLNPPSVIEDTSWIKPTRALWAWWSTDFGAQLLSEAMQYVDFAQAMGFEAVLLDAGWDYTWIKEFCDYAHARGISPWLWSAMQYINTPETAQKYLPLWKSYGIDGIKIDFYQNDSAHTASCYHLNAEIMREQKLMINFHGSTKPMGEGRTWPHLMTCEGILGLEHYKWSDQPDAEHNCTVPFIRNAAGPMDYTPTGFSNRNRNTTMAHQMALAAVFESGIQHYGASMYHLEAWEGTAFLRRLKAKYDGVKVLSGYPGGYAALLRWVEKTKEWVVGCITNQSRALTVRFDFLPEGEFEAEIFGDTDMGYDITYEKIKVNKDSQIILNMPEHGGAGIYVAKTIAPLTLDTESGYMSNKRVNITAEEMRLLHGSERLMLSETKSAVLLSGGAAFIVDTLPEQKRYTLRCFYSSEKPCELLFSDGKTSVKMSLPGNVAQGVYTTGETAMVLGAGRSRLMVRKIYGDAPVIQKIVIIDNAPPDTLVLAADEAIISGGAELILQENGTYMAASVGLGGEMLYDLVPITAASRYILRINYFAGIEGTAWVSINDGEPIRAGLGGMGGWIGTRRGEHLAREILTELPEGWNTIRIFNSEAALPYIDSISVTPFTG